MRLRRKSIVLLIVMGLLLTYLTLYTVAAHNVARQVFDFNGIAVWRSAPCGSFFPWPRGSGLLQILSDMTEADLFIYIYLIKSWVLIGVTIFLWGGWFLYLLKVFRKRQSLKEREHARKAENEKSKEEKERIDLQELRKKYEIPPPG